MQKPCTKWDCDQGYYPVLKKVKDGEYVWRWVTCPLCNGKGYIEPPGVPMA